VSVSNNAVDNFDWLIFQILIGKYSRQSRSLNTATQ